MEFDNQQIRDELHRIYTNAIEDDFDEESGFHRLSGTALDIDEFCAGGLSYNDAESFTVKDGNILWMDESDEWHNLNAVLGFTPGDIAEEAYHACRYEVEYSY